jgi:hypothetical protein
MLKTAILYQIIKEEYIFRVIFRYNDLTFF